MDENENFDEVLELDVARLKDKLNIKQAGSIRLNLLERIVKRLNSFSGTCDACRESTGNLKAFTDKMNTSWESFNKTDFKNYHITLKYCISHMEKNHKLVTEGYYASLYMAIFMPIGIAIGIAFNASWGIAVGITAGMCIGLAVGSGMDADAKKKGLII